MTGKNNETRCATLLNVSPNVFESMLDSRIRATFNWARRLVGHRIETLEEERENHYSPYEQTCIYLPRV